MTNNTAGAGTETGQRGLYNLGGLAPVLLVPAMWALATGRLKQQAGSFDDEKSMRCNKPERGASLRDLVKDYFVPSNALRSS